MDYPISGTFPVLPIRNAVIFPGLSVPLRVGRAKSVAAVKQAQTDGWVLVVSQRGPDSEAEPRASSLHSVGTLAKIERVRGSGEQGYQLNVRGVSRHRLMEVREEDGYIAAKAEVLGDAQDAEPTTERALLDSLKTLSKDILKLVPVDTESLEELVEGVTDLGFLTHLCAGNLELPVGKKQELLETVSVKARTLALLDLMQAQKENLELQSEIREKLSHKLGQRQREAILREQLNTIRDELGEGDEAGIKNDYRKKIEDADMPADVRKVAESELKRLESMGSSSPESHVIRNYLDLLVAMPWNKSAPDREIDLEEARRILDEDHYGLPKVKKRILQHLAVMKLKKSKKGSILLLVGPPGVGKTSLGQSIARALGRKYVRGALGGVRDDAEIRGHRRTYIGALPGRVIQGIKRAGENNPVFILDEIDKLARGYQGDPAGALLEVLDPEQNAAFMDHYLDVPFDLSGVFFIATANSLDGIPGPLLDRMEVIELSGYTTAEKLHIAKNHLLPKQLAEHGLTGDRLAVSDEALLRVITHYSREAGVRELQRLLAALCRASTERVLAAAEGTQVRVELGDLDEALGPERYQHEVAERLAPAGVVTGLAWTPQGGDILFIEAGLMQGQGRLTITGQLGEVMKESAQIALSLVRSRLPAIVPVAIQASGPGFEYDKRDLHIHVPAGAIPKDGPSAGVTMVTALASLLAGRPVSPKLAMTGEITLRGAVMPVGGIKEKVIAAHRAGIERILLPKRNQKDLRDVPDEVKSQLKFDFVDTVEELLKLALGLDLAGPGAGLGGPTPQPPAPAVA